MTKPNRRDFLRRGAAAVAAAAIPAIPASAMAAPASGAASVIALVAEYRTLQKPYLRALSLQSEADERYLAARPNPRELTAGGEDDPRLIARMEELKEYLDSDTRKAWVAGRLAGPAADRAEFETADERAREAAGLPETTAAFEQIQVAVINLEERICGAEVADLGSLVAKARFIESLDPYAVDGDWAQALADDVLRLFAGDAPALSRQPEGGVS